MSEGARVESKDRIDQPAFEKLKPDSLPRDLVTFPEWTSTRAPLSELCSHSLHESEN